MKVIDARGLSCPAPVLQTRIALEEGNLKAIRVVVDNEAAQQNVKRFLESQGFDIALEKVDDHYSVMGQCDKVTAKKPSEASEAEARQTKIMIMIATDRIGYGDDKLGLKLMVSFIRTLKEMGPDLWRLVFVNNGVNLAIQSSEVLVDLKELENTPEMMGSEGLGPDAPLLRAFSDCPKPIIGAINGFAVTGGFELALACDFLYAADTAKFADTHARVGLLPGWGLSQKLPRLVGINRAREISFSGNYFSAEQAMEWGLVNAVYPQNELLEAALDIAHQISTALPDALYRIKAMMNQGWEMTLGDGLEKEGQASSDYNSKVEFSSMKE